MKYSLIIPPYIDGELKKLKKKDKAMHNRVFKKLREIIENPESAGEPKGYVFRNSRAAHIGHCVLIWMVEQEVITLLRFTHHDHAYKWS